MNPNSMKHTFNPVLWLVIGLPSLAVMASFATLFIALRSSDVPLPARYHWEGAAFAAEQARLVRARSMNLSAQLRFDPVTQRCKVKLYGAQPQVLRLELTDGSKPANDRHLQLQRDGDSYSAPCTALPSAHWWIELADDATDWTLRDRMKTDFSVPLVISGERPGHSS